MMNIVPMKPKQSTQNTENLDSIAKEAIWGGMRKYLSEKTSPIDPYTDIYYITYALVKGVLAFAMQETQDIMSSRRATKVVVSALMNALRDWNAINGSDVMTKATKH